MKFKRLAFIHIEKCGGSTLIHMLRSSFGIYHCDIIAKEYQNQLVSKSDFGRVSKLCSSTVSFAGHSIRLYHNKDIKQDKRTGFYTILREPVSRYLSDFKHFGSCFSSVKNIEGWLKVDARKNFMTRSIAGEPNLNKAVDIIHKNIVLVGTMELYDEFINQLRLLFYPNLLTKRYDVRNMEGKRYEGFLHGMYEKIAKINTDVNVDFMFDYNKYEDTIIKNNELDIKLYNYVKTQIIPEQQQKFKKLADELGQHKLRHTNKSSLMIKFIMNRAFRNLVYKPSLGLYPVPYKLELYKNV
ncbi:MAG: hypothetical protein PF690_02160 [Deltaproteobacteria bacterium]|jgi:hypothetical protein|nr:hypothetical protein [Deltaproteobacteria bacterium]